VRRQFWNVSTGESAFLCWCFSTHQNPTFTLKINDYETSPSDKEAVTTEEIIFKYLKSICPIQVNN